MENEYWLRLKKGGRSRFIWREMVLKWAVPVWLTWTLLMSLLAFKTEAFSAQKIASIGLIGLPFWLLGGYLTGRWRWNELGQKHSKD